MFPPLRLTCWQTSAASLHIALVQTRGRPRRRALVPDVIAGFGFFMMAPRSHFIHSPSVAQTPARCIQFYSEKSCGLSVVYQSLGGQLSDCGSFFQAPHSRLLIETSTMTSSDEISCWADLINITFRGYNIGQILFAVVLRSTHTLRSALWAGGSVVFDIIVSDLGSFGVVGPVWSIQHFQV